MKTALSFILLAALLLSTQGCGKKDSVPTNFKMTLGANVAIELGLAGGIILTGNNGSDKFSAGLTPAQAGNFTLELPSGDWSFRAVGWTGGASGMMTGESRCGHTTATVGDTDTVIELSLSSAKCLDGVIAESSAQDSIAGGPHFKKVGLTSCLSLNGVTGGSLCDGAGIQQLPGMSTSVRLFFPGVSNFGANLPSLNSKCYNHPGHAAQSFTDGYIPTDVRLPFDGAQPLPWGLVGYEEKNCAERGAVYPMPDGINGTQGLDRLYDYLTTEIHINFADNYIGKGLSVFATLTPGDILPDVSCAPNCYPSTNLKPFNGNDYLREDIKFQIWDTLGNPDRVDPHDIQGGFPATASSGTVDLFFQTSPELGSWGNSFNVMTTLNNGLGIEATANCTDTTINIEYSTTDGATTLDVVNAVNASCGHLVNASTGSPAQTMSGGESLPFSGGTNSLSSSAKDSGELFEIRDLLVGPIGAGLYQNGITNRTQLCDTASYGSYSFVIDGENITMELGTPSASALHPEFSPTPATQFERRLRLSFDGTFEEAFYFDCVNKPGVGSYLSRSQEPDGTIETKQMYWNSAVGEEWVEVANKEEDPGGSLVRQDYFLFKANATNDFDAYLLKANPTSGDYNLSVGRALAGELFVQGMATSAGDSDPAFIRDTLNDEIYTINSGDYQGLQNPINTREPSTINADMYAPNMFTGYDMSSFLSGSDNFWDLTY